jgi:predicted DNA-binding protein
MHGNKKHNSRTFMLAFKTTLEIKDAIKHLAENENKTISTYVHDVMFNHYRELIEAEAVQESKQQEL